MISLFKKRSAKGKAALYSFLAFKVSQSAQKRLELVTKPSAADDSLSTLHSHLPAIDTAPSYFRNYY